MTKKEAIHKAEQGIKITHRSFTREEYVTWDRGLFVDENGYHLDFLLFFKDRIGDNWEEGWSEWVESNGKN